MRHASAPLLAATLVALAACAPDYAYVPTTNATASVNGRVASDYPVPPEAPRGDVRVATFGFADLTPNGEEDASHVLRSIHARLVVANESAAPWTLDTREQRLDLTGRGESAPAYASADPGSPPPVVTIPPGGKRTIDLFFPLPADQQHAKEIPDFDVIWNVHTAARDVVERTPFERIVLQPPPSYYDYGPYWYDPMWSGFYGYPEPMVYVHVPVHVRSFHGGFHGGFHHGGGRR